MKTRIGQFPGWIISRHSLCLFVFLLLPIACLAQVNSGSDGSDKAFNPTVNTNIDMGTTRTGFTNTRPSIFRPASRLRSPRTRTTRQSSGLCRAIA